MTFAASITVPQTRPDDCRALWEQLMQDGFSPDQVCIPSLTSPEFAVLLSDAMSYANEVRGQQATAWDVRSVRWLQRLSTGLTGKLFTDLAAPQRRAICHAAATLSATPELCS